MAMAGSQPQPQIIPNINEVFKRKSKWGEDYEKIFHPPPLQGIARNINLEDVEYIIRLYRLDELYKKQNLGQYDHLDRDCRSPSPEPVYDKIGRRVNTVEQRAKDSMNREIQDIVEELINMNVGFVPPRDWKIRKRQRKVYLPESEHSENNYVGIILGQNGVTQKSLETKSNCKISIRGRNGIKTKKEDADEQTHVLVQANTDEDLDKGVELVEKVLRGDPDELSLGERADRINQIAIYQTLNKVCENCRGEGHKIWECPVKRPDYNRKPLVQCEICKDMSHPTSDCPQRRGIGVKTDKDTVKVQSEFHKFVLDIRKEISDRPSLENPGSYMNFVTNVEGVKAMITESPAHNQQPAQANPSQDPLATIFPQKKTIGLEPQDNY